jgi:hypothetical protein
VERVILDSQTFSVRVSPQATNVFRDFLQYLLSDVFLHRVWPRSLPFNLMFDTMLTYREETMAPALLNLASSTYCNSICGPMYSDVQTLPSVGGGSVH